MKKQLKCEFGRLRFFQRCNTGVRLWMNPGKRGSLRSTAGTRVALRQRAHGSCWGDSLRGKARENENEEVCGRARDQKAGHW